MEEISCNIMQFPQNKVGMEQKVDMLIRYGKSPGTRDLHSNVSFKKQY